MKRSALVLACALAACTAEVGAPSEAGLHVPPSAVETFEFRKTPRLGKTARVNPEDPSQRVRPQTLFLGGLSGLRLAPGHCPGRRALCFLAVPDKGPGGERADTDGDGIGERPFPLPDYQARVVTLRVVPGRPFMRVFDELLLFRQDGTTPISGRSNLSDESIDEEGVDLFGNPIPYDGFGGDMEGVEVAPDGSLWLVDEYRPSIYHFHPDGVLIERYVPRGTAALVGKPKGSFGRETLPAVYLTRRRNRGFEAVAYDTEHDVVYAMIQTPLQNPDRAASDSSLVIRMLGIDPISGIPVSEYVYLLDPALRVSAGVDKIGDAVFAGFGTFLVIERDSAVGPEANKRIYRIDVSGATNLLCDALDLLEGLTLEQHTPAQLAEAGIVPVRKDEVVNLPSIGYIAGDKPEGIALTLDHRIVVINDNDFGLAVLPFPIDGTIPLLDPRPPSVLGILR